MLPRDASYFMELQTQTGWGRTLFGFAKWCSAQPGWRTLDVGCGPGLLPAIFAQAGCRAVGIDLDEAMFRPLALYPDLTVANLLHLPFKTHIFDLVTASNVLFLMNDPVQALRDLSALLAAGGRIAMLNPSEALNEQAAARFADENRLQGFARQTLINWARRAAANYHWTEEETHALYHAAGMKCMATELKVGPGFGRFSWGKKESGD